MNKLGYSEKAIGRMTLGKFMALRQAYKDTFDLELMLESAKKTYKDLEEMATQDDEMPF